MDNVAKLAGDLGKGKRDAVDLTEEILAAIATCDDQAIFIDVLAERARSEAKAARKRLKAGTPLSPLDGVPIGWKDLFDIQGRVTTAASLVMQGNPSARADAALVAAGRAAGMVTLGTLNMTEFAYSGIGLNPHYGTPRNPNGTGPARAPGGSSSGSAVVVAKGLLPVAIGTDTGGSIRIPAAFNGVVGYKSSTGHYAMDGVFPLSRTLDSLGPFAQTVEDCVLVDAVLRGQKRPRLPKLAVRGIEILIPANVVLDGLEPAVQSHFEAALKRISKAGAKIRRKPFPAFEAILDLNKTRGSILSAEALHLHFARVNGPDAARMDQRVVQRIKFAQGMSAVDLVEIQQRRLALIAATNALIGDAFVMMPTTPHVAMPIGPLEADVDEFFRNNVKTLRNTNLGNVLDWCGLSIPCGRDAVGMPVGMMLTATHGRDAALLAAGLALESLIRG